MLYSLSIKKREAQWCEAIIPALRRLRQMGHKFKARLSCIARLRRKGAASQDLQIKPELGWWCTPVIPGTQEEGVGGL